MSCLAMKHFKFDRLLVSCQYERAIRRSSHETIEQGSEVVKTEADHSHTVNSRYCRYSRDCELVSSKERVHNNGGLSQSNVYKKIATGIWLLSALVE